MILIDALPAFTDNYLWLLQEPLSKRCAVVDPGDAAPVLAWLAAHPGWQLTDILVTHHHPDHVGGVLQLKAHCGARVHGPAKENIPGRDTALNEGDCIEVLGLPFRVLEVPGHTLGHIAYYHAAQDLLPPCGYPPTHIAASPLHRHAAKEPLLFCGDTLFAGGCGRLFEGTPAQMHHSLQRLAQLPSNCLIYCTHEYTLSNLHFAHTVEPHNSEIAARLASVVECRAKGRSTLPSNMALEHATNPFLRCHEQDVKQRVDQRDGCQHASVEAVFASLRAWKNQF